MAVIGHHSDALVVQFERDRHSNRLSHLISKTESIESFRFEYENEYEYKF